MDAKLFCVLLRGKPAAGKTTILKSINLQNFEILDPDNIILNSEEFRKFKPRKYKNPTINTKTYCYLFNKAETYLRERKNILWLQPWSRLAEIELTIRNFGYYFADLGNSNWICNLKDILIKLPFKVVVIEIDVNDDVAYARYTNRKQSISNKDELIRLKKTMLMYQKYELPTDFYALNGNTDLLTVKKEFLEILTML